MTCCQSLLIKHDDRSCFLFSPSGWTRVTPSTWRGWLAGVWTVNSSVSLKPWGAGRTCRTRWEPEAAWSPNLLIWFYCLLIFNICILLNFDLSSQTFGTNWSEQLYVSSSGVSYLSASSLRWTPLEPTTLWLTWSLAFKTSTPTTPSPLCPTRKALLCCTTWRSWWEGQVTPGHTCTHHKLSDPEAIYSPLGWWVCLLQRCSWVSWSRISRCLPTAASLQRNGRTTCSPTSKTRWETPERSAASVNSKDHNTHTHILMLCFCWDFMKKLCPLSGCYWTGCSGTLPAPSNWILAADKHLVETQYSNSW